MTYYWECRSAASLRQAREGDFLIAIFPGEQPHVERAGEPGNPGETLDDADVRSGHQDGLIDILRLRIIEHDGVRPEVVGLQNASDRIGDTDDDRGFFDLLLERREPMHGEIPARNQRNLAQLLRHIHRQNPPGRRTPKHAPQGRPSCGARRPHHGDHAIGKLVSVILKLCPHQGPQCRCEQP